MPGAGPVLIHPLTRGLVNESCRVERGGRLYALRVAGTASRDLGLDRRWECEVLGVAARAGLAPAVEYCDPTRGILITEWVQGRPWSTEEAQRPAAVDAMAHLLRRTHALALPQQARAMNPAAWIAHYAGAAARRGVRESPPVADLRTAAGSHLAALAALPGTDRVLCHGDLHRLNIMVGSRLVLLDWEYAHVSDPLWDLAGWISNNDWAEDSAVLLLASYRQRPLEANERTRLRILVWLYEYVCLLWSELYLSDRPSPASGEVAARAERLGRRLKRPSGSREV